jgi:hypothetical protein
VASALHEQNSRLFEDAATTSQVISVKKKKGYAIQSEEF